MRDNRFEHSRSDRKGQAWDSKERSNRHKKNLGMSRSEKGANEETCAIVSYEHEQGSTKRTLGEPHHQVFEIMSEGDMLMGNRLASVIVSPEMQSYIKGDNVTLRNKSVAKSLTYSPHGSANASGDEHVNEALSGMEVETGIDAEEDLFDEELEEMAAKSRPSVAARATLGKGQAKASRSARSSASGNPPLGIQNNKAEFHLSPR
ncbi:unnamed protein product [Eruca vesicaria subsp. sativa]|uniref:Uncharacterized protein n=1 Tax=Eruca vesicaria subsp. sativa TaxID=29727 RepID=A0ABC8JUN7_ERUVS|nr:unnamed protein product [Eruca vesicaria subsp. sativa]